MEAVLSAHYPRAFIGEPGHDGTSIEPALKGLVHLLDTPTVQRFFSLATVAGHSDRLTALLFQGKLPAVQDGLNDFANWILLLDEPKLNAAVLKMGNFSVKMNAPNVIQSLLKAVKLEPGSAYPNVDLSFELLGYDDLRLELPQFMDLNSTDAKFNNICIRWINKKAAFHYLGGFFDVLCSIKDLKLVATDSGSMDAEDVNHLARLFTLNKSILSADLCLPDISTPGACHGLGPMVHAGYLRLCRELDSQKEIASFQMMYVTKQVQEILGDFLGASHSIRMLSLASLGTVVTPRLIEGIKKNKSLQTLRLSFCPTIFHEPQAEGSIVPLMTLLKENGSCATSLIFTLTGCTSEALFSLFRARDAERSNLTLFGSMLASNSTLNKMQLILPDASHIDLLGIADGLEKNKSLEEFSILFESAALEPNNPVPCPDQRVLREFFEKIEKNWTLVNLLLGNPEEMGLGQTELDQLERLFQRNRRFRSCACSFAYIHGAAAGFMRAREYPSDPSIVIAHHLSQQRPKIAARSLAMINRAAGKSTADARRRDIAENIRNNRLPGEHNSMDAYLEEIAASPFLAEDLIYWMDTDPATYMQMVKRFCMAVGILAMRKKIIAHFCTVPDLNEHRLTVLEATFPPSQKLLAFLRSKGFNYNSDEPIALRFAIAYAAISAGSDNTAVLEWCKRNEMMPIYLKYMSLFQAQAVRLEKKV